MDLQGRAAIVTGSATGIGAETAKLLAAKGCNVVVNYSRSKGEAEETADECRKAGADVLLISADVSKDEDCGARQVEAHRCAGEQRRPHQSGDARRL